MGAPTNEAFRWGIKAHVTHWINNIEQYENVPMDLTVNNLVLGADSNLRNMHKKFTKLTSGVVRDTEQAGVTQAQFKAAVASKSKWKKTLEKHSWSLKEKWKNSKTS